MKKRLVQTVAQSRRLLARIGIAAGGRSLDVENLEAADVAKGRELVHSKSFNKTQLEGQTIVVRIPLYKVTLWVRLGSPLLTTSPAERPAALSSIR